MLPVPLLPVSQSVSQSVSHLHILGRRLLDTKASMGAFPWKVLCGLALIQTFVSSSPVPRYFQNNLFTRRNISVTEIAQELGVIVSYNSTIFLPSDLSWSNATERWNTLAPPNVELVVQPAEESDISKIVSASMATTLFDNGAYSIFRSNIATTTVSSTWR